MIMRVLHGLAKWNALRKYRASLPRLLVERYGREQHYTPPQVLTTIRLHRLSERYAAYACAMFCSKRAYSDFVASHLRTAEASFQALDDSSIPLWAVASVQDWAVHDIVVADIGRGHWDHHGPDLVADHFGHHASDFGTHHSGAGGHDGSHEDGTGGDSSH